ncbi:MAG: preprotein translocase subunit SecG [Bacilli bacterium]|nr:preprotein translocase subunit SecG [Bacilli bacterium]
MEILLMIVSVLLIALGLLQSGKAEGAGNVLQGGNSDLFSNRKERGGELLISRITFGLGMAFFLISFLMSTNIFK